MLEDQIFYVGQKAFIRKDSEVLVLILPDGKLDFPGGKIQVGEEDFNASLIREVKEETGLDIEVGKPFYRWCFELHPNHPKAGHKVFLIGFKCEFKSGSVELSSEHVGYKWINKDTFNELQEDRGHFEALEEYFKSL